MTATEASEGQLADATPDKVPGEIGAVRAPSMRWPTKSRQHANLKEAVEAAQAQLVHGVVGVREGGGLGHTSEESLPRIRHLRKAIDHG
jgi:hypothetical protein